MRWKHVYLALSLAAACSWVAHADTIGTFGLSSVFESGAIATGTVTIDITTGVATSADITYTLGGTPTVFDTINSQTGFTEGIEFAEVGPLLLSLLRPHNSRHLGGIHRRSSLRCR